MAVFRFSVPGISCQHCVDAITKEVKAIDGVQSVTIDIENTEVTVVGGTEASLVEAIDEAGYEVVG